jgi:hypothetical protein
MTGPRPVDHVAVLVQQALASYSHLGLVGEVEEDGPLRRIEVSAGIGHFVVTVEELLAVKRG